MRKNGGLPTSASGSLGACREGRERNGCRLRSGAYITGRITSQIVILSLFYINPAVFCEYKSQVLLLYTYVQVSGIITLHLCTVLKKRGLD